MNKLVREPSNGHLVTLARGREVSGGPNGRNVPVRLGGLSGRTDCWLQ